MVDINLIGDDKSGEEERVEDFTQTSSMDTQELAFEERTETFDTTKTAGFAPKRSYSSLMSTLIILAVILLLGGSIYFFMFGGDDNSNQQAAIPAFDPPAADDMALTTNDPEFEQLSQEFADDLSSMDNPIAETQFDEVESEPVPDLTPPPRQEVVTQPPVRRPAPSSPPPSFATADLDPTSSDFISSSRGRVQAVTNLMSAMPSNLNTTLLSFTGNRMRLEFVANTSGDAADFTGRLNQLASAGQLSVVSQNQVASNGGAMEKVLVSGTMGTNGSVSPGESVSFLNLGQARDWLRKTAKQYSITVRELSPQQGSFSGGYQKVPILARLYGGQASVVGFLEEITAQAYNIELAKILLVSPDVINYQDDNLILVLNMFLYEQS